MADSYLNKTFGTPTDTKKYTMSVWVKRSSLGVQQSIARSTNGNDDSHVFTFNSDDSLRWDEYGSSSTIGTLKTNRKFRDTSAWYHVVLWYDSANGTAGDRMRMWINGVEETSFATDTNPSVNAASAFNKASQPINIGRTSYSGGTNYFDGYLAHMAFVDGSNVAHTTFGETDSTSGIWKFKSPSGITWGTNGFHLKFENSANLGLDSSSNASNWTVNGTLKQSLNTPSNSYATFNPLFQKSLPSTVNMGNTRLDQGSSAWKSSLTTIGASAGKWYAEFKAGTISSGSPYKYNQFGVVHESITSGGTFGYVGDSDYGWGLNWGGNVNHDGQNVSGYTGFTTGDIISVAMDLDNHKVYWRKNGAAWMNGGDPTSGSTGTGAQSLDTGKIYFFAASVYANECFANFGNGFFGTTAITSAGSNGNGSLFEYDVPSGYYALNTKNINTYG
jgi:hypothetical protein